MSEHNVFNLPIYGKPITLDDVGIYYAVNRKTGGINNVFNLVYETSANQDGDWYLYQLKNTNKDGEMGWVILADFGDYPLKSVSSEEIKQYFDQPEYAEPKGAWQLIKNSKYGFGKFTPLLAETENLYAMILFSSPEAREESNSPHSTKISGPTKMLGSAKMLVPLLIRKAEDEVLQSLSQLKP